MDEREVDRFQEVYNIVPSLGKLVFEKIGGALRDAIEFAARGVKILDAGCGNTDDVLGRDSNGRYDVSRLPRVHEPWFARAAVWQGADVTGLDFAPEAPEVKLGTKGGRWQYVKHDLTAEAPFDVGRGFDIVCMNGVVHCRDIFEGAPNLMPGYFRALASSKAFELSSLRPLQSEDFKELEVYRQIRTFVLGEVMRVLKPGGVFVFNDLRLVKSPIKGEGMLPQNVDTRRVLSTNPEIARMPFEAREVAALLDGLQNR